MDSDKSQQEASLPEASAESVGPNLRALPSVPSAKYLFLRDTVSWALLFISIASIVYLIFYAASAGWHDAADDG